MDNKNIKTLTPTQEQEEIMKTKSKNNKQNEVSNLEVTVSFSIGVQGLRGNDWLSWRA